MRAKNLATQTKTKVELVPDGFTAPLLQNVLKVFGTAFLGSISVLVLQHLAATISVDHLNARSFASHLTIPFSVLGLTTGGSMLILLSKDQDDRNILFTGGFYITFFSALVMTIIGLLVTPHYLSFANVTAIPGVHLHSLLLVMTGCLSGMTTFLYLSLISKGRAKYVISIMAMGTVSSTIGGWIAVTLLADNGDKFVTLAIVELSIQSLLVFVFAFAQREDFVHLKATVSAYLRRASSIIWSEALFLFLLMLDPLIFSLAFKSFGVLESVAAYNVGFSIANLLLSPLAAINACGTAALSACWSRRSTGAWDKNVSAIRNLSLLMSGLPLLLVLVFLPILLEFFFNLKSVEAATISACVIASILPTILTCHIICQIRTYERAIFFSYIQLATIYAIGLPVVLWFSRSSSIIEAAFFGILLPTLFQGLALYMYSTHAVRHRRSSTRFKIPVESSVFIHLFEIDGSSCILRIPLIDIGNNGCGGQIQAPFLRSLVPGARIKGEIHDARVGMVHSFSGEVRHVSSKRAIFMRSLFRIGIKFTDSPSRSEEKIDLLIRTLIAR